MSKCFSERIMWIIEQEQFCDYFFLKETLQFCNTLLNLFHFIPFVLSVCDLKSASAGLAELVSNVQVRTKPCWIIWCFSFHSCVSLVWGKYRVYVREFIKEEESGNAHHSTGRTMGLYGAHVGPCYIYPYHGCYLQNPFLRIWKGLYDNTG